MRLPEPGHKAGTDQRPRGRVRPLPIQSVLRPPLGGIRPTGKPHPRRIVAVLQESCGWIQELRIVAEREIWSPSRLPQFRQARVWSNRTLPARDDRVVDAEDIFLIRNKKIPAGNQLTAQSGLEFRKITGLHHEIRSRRVIHPVCIWQLDGIGRIGFSIEFHNRTVMSVVKGKGYLLHTRCRFYSECFPFP
jgi:hypothetical protein